MRSKRYPTLENARLEIYGHSTVMMAKMKNLSQTGAFFELSQAQFIPKIGDYVNVTVRLTSIARERQMNAQVVWTKGLGVGVCFVSREQVMDHLFQRS